MVRVAACFFFLFSLEQQKRIKMVGECIIIIIIIMIRSRSSSPMTKPAHIEEKTSARTDSRPSGTKEKMMGRGGEPQKPEREGRRQTYVVTVLWRRHGGAVCCLDAWLYPVLWGRLLSIGLVFKGQPVYCRVFFFVLMIAETTQTCASPNG